MDNVTAGQLELLKQLKAFAPAATVQWDETRGVAQSIRGALADTPISSSQAPAATVNQFLGTFGSLFGPPDLAEKLRALPPRGDDLGWTHLEHHQVLIPARRGRPSLEVYGAKLIGHVTNDGALREIESSCWRDVSVETRPRVTLPALRRLLVAAAAAAPGYAALAARMKEHGQKTFPIMQPPRLVVYFWQDGFRLAWTTYAYAPVPAVGPRRELPEIELVLGQVFVDALTGERFLFSPTGLRAEVPAVGSGLGVTRSGGAFVVRPINVVREGVTTTHRLRDTTHARDIITYDLAVDPDLSSVDAMALAVTATPSRLPVSTNAGGNAWTTVANPSIVSRANAQQPEVDAHFFARQAYEWYDALSGGRAGWDNGRYPVTTVPPALPVRVATHVYPDWKVNAEFNRSLVNNRWIPFLILWDCDLDQACVNPGDRAVDYMAGSRNIVGHEYQHGITAFSFIDNFDNPGLGTVGWARALQEGLSDVFGGFFSNVWAWGPEISPVGLVLRSAAFPRDVTTWENQPGSGTCGWSHKNRDHFADRVLSPTQPGEEYDNGTILAHCAFLLGAGGVHERAGRVPALVPVRAVGSDTLAGLPFSRAARIFYRALDVYLQAHVTLIGKPNLDERMFRAVREGCVKAAEDLYGAGSAEDKATRLAFYAVGLQPPTETYGADVTCLAWAAAWAGSRPHLGGIYSAAPDWGSVDLFVNNDGVTSEWNALINVVDGGGPTHFENTVYCRVRNVGDRAAENVTVQFSYARVGTMSVSWLPVTDRNGVAQTLTIPGLGAGQSTFDEASQNTPPANASVKWDIAPIGPGEVINHFCLRATLTCAGNANPAADDVNPFNNTVQSNVAYVAYTPPQPLLLPFVVGNPFDRDMEARLTVTTELPEGWTAWLSDHVAEVRLPPYQERVAKLAIAMPKGADAALEPPLDGVVEGELTGPLSGRCRGALTATAWDGERLRGRLAAQLGGLGYLQGDFTGTVDTATGAVSGIVVAAFQNAATGEATRVGVGLEGQLRPWRRVHVVQTEHGRPVGGFTVQIQGATPGDLDARALPGTHTRVRAPDR